MAYVVKQPGRLVPTKPIYLAVNDGAVRWYGVKDAATRFSEGEAWRQARKAGPEATVEEAA
jgi:hypothetical protein